MNKYLPLHYEARLKRLVVRALRCQFTVKTAIKICFPVAAALFFLTLVLAFNLNETVCLAMLKIEKTPASKMLGSQNLTSQVPSVCLNESCKIDYVRHVQPKVGLAVPAIRHIVWKSDLVSENYAEQLRTWHRIHPDWTFVLWRDADLDPFVATHFPELLRKFRSLPDHIMRVDMIRYMLLFKYGGVYADLDYRLVRSLDTYRRFPALITREPEMHAMQFLGVSWPPPLMSSPAFMMSTPGHEFFRFALHRLGCRKIIGVLHFAGPLGLAEIIREYQTLLPVATNAAETLYVPPSYVFHPYPENRFNNCRGSPLETRFHSLRRECKLLLESQMPKWQQLRQVPQLRLYCADLNNLDPITDKSQTVYAIHDVDKPGPAYHVSGANFFSANLTNARQAVGNLVLGSDFMLRG